MDNDNDTADREAVAEKENVPAREQAAEPEEKTEPTEAEAQRAAGEEGEAEQDEAPPEEVEFDFGGNKRKFRKDATVGDISEDIETFVKGVWTDYSTKSSAVAAERKSLEAQRAAVQKMHSLSEQTQQEYANGLYLKNELARLQKIDANELWRTDPDRARQLSDTISRTLAEFNSSVNNLAALERTSEAERAKELAHVAEEGRRVVIGKIKDFETHLPALKEYAAKEYGVSQRDADAWALNPVAAIMAFKAMKYDQMMAKAATAAKPKPAPIAAPIKPMPAKGTAGASKDPARMSVAEMARHLGLPA